MKWQQLILLLSVVYMNCQGNVDYELTYPERLSENRVKRDLSTATENGHENTATFAINAFQKKWVLDAKQNHHLMPKAFTVKTFDSDDNEVISRKAPEPCHYQGSIRGIPDSVVVLDTCSGLRGLIDDGTQSYQIEPHDDFQETGAHRISKDEIEFDADEHCGTEFDESSPKAAYPKSSKLAKTLKRLRRGLGHVVDTEDIYRSYLTTNETKYTEVVFVVDNGVYLRFNKTKPVIDKVLILCNAVDAVYQRINIRIVAIAIEIWTNGDRMPRGKDLKNFAVYRRNKIKIPNDNAQFLSHHGWGRAIGIAYLGGMCSAKISCGINKFNTKSLLGPLVTVAHEMGHNFGFGHNKPPCKCLTPKGCFMYGGQGRTNLPGFSDCNLNKIKKKKHSCLFNVPTYNMNARCGNGIKENDEECDCGTPEMCKQKDPCCQPHDCRLKPSSQCSDLHHTCCQDCQFKKQGSICRKVKTDCDVPEHCPGDSGDCPDDATLTDGTPCNSNSYCYSGNCAETREKQCQDLWGSGTKDAAQGCYDKLNTEAKGYGTCDPGSNSSCAAEDVLCGQIQCSSSRKTPKVKYGKSYKAITLADSSKCSAAVLKTSDDTLGQGMVQDGTKCGHEKICSGNQCKSFAELNIKKCPVVNGKVCNGQGVCTSSGVCHCHGLFDPKTGCKNAFAPQNGGFSNWSDWSKCTAVCNGGKQTRHRFCNNPFPMYGGKDCQGKLHEERDCNTKACPKANSCRHLQLISTSNNQIFHDGVYDIYPRGPSNPPIKTYCDMSRDGGGWTLLVSSATNTWTADDVMSRNAGKPSLTDDYSILKYADVIKDNQKVQGSTFEYRLEADRPGRWGGIWEADRSYTFTAKNNKQTNVRLLKKFDNWTYSSNGKGIGKRMPWISGALLTTSANPKNSKRAFGSVTAKFSNYYPAPWINAQGQMKKPQYIWYWMREGPAKLQEYFGP